MTPFPALRSLRAAAPLVLLAGALACPVPAGARSDGFDGLPPVRACEASFTPRWHPPVGRHLAAMPREARPDKGEPHIDRVHGSCLLRVTDHASEMPSGLARNDPARRPSLNADESRLLVADRDGQWHLYEARTLQHGAALPDVGADAEPQWHPGRPELLYHLPRRGAGLQLLELDLRTGRTRVAADFAPRVKPLWPTAHALGTGGAGAASADGRYWAFMVEDAARGALGLFTWDLQENRLLARHDFEPPRKDRRPERLAMSPSGRYVVVSGPDGATAFTRELTQPRRLPGDGAHAELALTADGEDAWVAVDRQADGSPLFLLRLRTGERTELFSTDLGAASTALQVSGRAHRRPGWVLVSTYGDRGKGARQWLHRRLMAVELKSSPRIVHLAFHRGHPATPAAGPRAAVNRDFTRVLFDSNWGAKSETDVDTYMVVLPRDALSRTAPPWP